MSLRQSARSMACTGCRTHLVRSFLSLAGISVPAAQQGQRWARRQFETGSRLPQAKPFTTQTRHLTASDNHDPSKDTPIPSATEAPEPQLDDHDDHAAAQTTSSPPAADDSAIPWYLQVNPPIAEQPHPLSERQRLPDLPDSPPDLLQPILEHVSVDLGLDDLSLLDLRALDPPPALGANLIMLIATARSEKHLHVSADRLCRWLRSNHSLSPFADGLLGRNELKLKLRRKAKRSRLLSAVGAKATASGDIDDGIRTGWVCVNVGKVPGGVLPDQQDIDAYASKHRVGFGTQTDGTTIVVQMMTDEKRGDMDLEALWNGILRRSNKALHAQEQDVDDAEQRIDKGHLIQDSTHAPVQGNEVYRPVQPPAHDTLGPRIQTRAFHTSHSWRLPLRSVPRPT